MNRPAIKNNYFSSFPLKMRLHRGLMFGIIIVAALLAFEFFNYSTTEFALSDLMGDLQFLGLRWATILSIAFCAIDFAGIARLFTPQEGANEPNEVWYLFAAWLLAATMNAMLTWWGVSIAILNHQSLGNAVVPHATLLRIVPIFVAVMVWLIRILIIGTLSVSGDRLFSKAERRANNFNKASLPVRSTSSSVSISASRPAASQSSTFKPAPKPAGAGEMGYPHSEPTYHPLSFSAKSPKNINTRIKG
jgi:hypothetical protein